ncbi:MAG: hypothetical protein JWM16_419 [Verrucomicrobiales bacterium]|nr:hypothetical protein [Verrucomicrobiales bacterium]
MRTCPGLSTGYASTTAQPVVLLGIVLSLFLSVGSMLADIKGHNNVSIGEEPAWVSHVPAGPHSNAVPRDVGEVHVLFDKQVNVETHQTFVRVVRRILNSTGIQNGSQVSAMFDPACSTLTLHRIQIRRGEQLLNRLDADNLQVLQRERELERHVYNGQLSVVALLNDVRQGDEIECSYTVTGANPIFDGKFFDSFALQFPGTLQHFRFRLLWPEGRKLFIRNQNTKLQPAIRELGHTREYVWEANDLPALMPEFNAPGWYDPYPRVQLSEFGSWQETAQWAARIFKPVTQVSPALEHQIAEWKSDTSSPDAALLVALQFVQDEIRYLGIEVGKQTHEPTDPSMVFERRFGDCKDKALLLCSILNRLGFQASPALVNATSAQAIEQWQPSPLAFNHVIVRLDRAGEFFWLDPTLSYQRGSLTQRSLPAYGRALVAQADATNLCAVAIHSNASPRTIVRESYSIKATNLLSELRVVSTLEGEDAESFRSMLAHAGRAEVERSLLDSYTREFADVTNSKPLEIQDSDKENRIQIVESYLLRGFWKDKDGWRKQCDIYPAALAALLPQPGSPNSQSPLAMAHPRRHLHIITVDLPECVTLQDKSQLIRGPAEELRIERVNSERNVRIEYDYRSLADSVPPERIPRHIRARSEMLDNIGLTLVWTPHGNPLTAPKALPANPFIAAGLVGFGIVMVVFWTAVKRREEMTAWR